MFVLVLGVKVEGEIDLRMFFFVLVGVVFVNFFVLKRFEFGLIIFMFLI